MHIQKKVSLKKFRTGMLMILWMDNLKNLLFSSFAWIDLNEFIIDKFTNGS